MAKTKNRTTKAPAAPSPFEEARDEMFQHIMRCGVVGSDPAHQEEWFNETMAYMTERYPELATEQIDELRKLGLTVRSASEEARRHGSGLKVSG
jgi:hypothetical protein